MFGKKAAETPQENLIPVVMLTLDYLIEGSAVMEKNLKLNLWALDSEEYGSARSLELRSAKLQPISQAQLPPHSMENFMARGDQLLVLIPRTGAPITDYYLWKEHKKAVPGTYFCGPYVITGSMMHLNPDVLGETMPMIDVRITSQRSGDSIGEITAPFVIVNTHWMIGYAPL